MMKKLNLKSKDTIQFIVSILVLLAGITIAFLSLYIQPVGVIHYSVITVLGMIMSFVGAVWNIDIKYDFKTKELESKFYNLRKEIDDE